MGPIGSDRVQKKWVNWIGNWEKGGQLDWISTQWGVNQIKPVWLRGLRMLKRAPNRIENLKKKVITAEPSYQAPSMGVPPTPPEKHTTGDHVNHSSVDHRNCLQTSKGHVTWIIEKVNCIPTHCGVACKSVHSLLEVTWLKCTYKPLELIGGVHLNVMLHKTYELYYSDLHPHIDE